MLTDTIYTVKNGTYAIDSFSVASLGAEVALANARASRDAYNASAFGQAQRQPARITRSISRRIVRPL